MGRDRDGGEEDASRVPQILMGLGVLFVLAILAEWAVFETIRPGQDFTRDYLLTLLLNGVPALLITYGGYWLARSEIEVDQYRRILVWCLGVAASFMLLNLVVLSIWPAETLVQNIGWIRGATIYAADGGLIMGVIEARAIRRARVAEREIARSEHVEEQRRWLGYMNSLLRHEVLNTANVIEGYAELLIEEDPDTLSEDRLEVIRRQSRNMTAVIDDVRVLLDATEEADEFEAVNLSAVLRERIAELRTTAGPVEIDASVPDDVYVVADDLLPRVFSNLLGNAVEHNDSDVPRVSVAVEATDRTVEVTVADNGPGIPVARRDDLFEGDTRTNNHGLGLYLVRTLAERYDGAVELRETGSEGSEFVVELRRASNRPAEATGPPDVSRTDSPAPSAETPGEAYESG